MTALGLAVGAVFPPFVELLGAPTEHSRALPFRLACLAAGLVLGGANWLLARHVIGTRLRLLASRLAAAAEAVGDPASGTSARRGGLDLPVASADDLGRTAAAFNALLAALDREGRFRSLVHATTDVIVLVDPQGLVAFVSDSVTDLLGWTSSQIVGRAARDLVHPDDAGSVDTLLDTGGDDASVFVVRVPRSDGGWRYLEMSSSDRREDPAISSVLLTARDVTDRLELQRQLAFQASHDELTGLPNRSAALAHGAELLRRRPQRLAVALIDLDRFKEVNDTLGHSYGDRLLAQVGTRLRPLVRDVDVVARLGGDEFAALLPDVTPEGARRAAVRLRDALQQPFAVDDLWLDVDASIGIAVVGEPGPDDIDALLRRADMAMYAAKERRTGVEVYDPAVTLDRPARPVTRQVRRTA